MNNMNAARKAREVDEYLQEERNQRNKKIGGILLLVLAAIIAVISVFFQVRGYGHFTMGALVLAKIAFFLGLAGIVLGIVMMFVTHNLMWELDFDTDYAWLYIVLDGIAAVVLIVFCSITLGKGILKHDGYITVDADGVVYAEVDYSLRAVGFKEGATDIVIRGEIDGRVTERVSGSGFRKNPYLKSVTFSGGKYVVKSKMLAGCPQLEWVRFENVEATLKNKVFHECYKLTDITVVNSSVGVSGTYLAGLSSSYSPKLVITLDSSTLSGCGDALPLLVLKGKSSYKPSYTVGKRLVLDESFEVTKDTAVYRPYYGFNTDFYPAAAEIYIPATVTSLPAGFFGNEGNCKVYYAGTQEQWSQIVIASDYNENYTTHERITVEYETTYSE